MHLNTMLTALLLASSMFIFDEKNPLIKKYLLNLNIRLLTEKFKLLS